MKTIKVPGRIFLAVTVFAALTAGSASLFSDARAAVQGCICPYVYAPVKCSNGVTYTNGCFASCAHATGCVPVGPGPVLL
ncbi:MAG TPA: hypothetical protein VFV19_13950 [Candidatus Polarisedimenticolaceae bacterium]|nr:hypothetical protein [Candidatus Polarisedimenticolaceae bacterium]